MFHPFTHGDGDAAMSDDDWRVVDWLESTDDPLAVHVRVAAMLLFELRRLVAKEPTEEERRAAEDRAITFLMAVALVISLWVGST